MLSLHEDLPLFLADDAPSVLADDGPSASTLATSTSNTTLLLLTALHQMIRVAITETSTTKSRGHQQPPNHDENDSTCTAIQNSNVDDRPSLSKILAPEEGGFLLTRAIIKAMEENASNVLLQEQGCRSLSLLSTAGESWLLEDCIPTVLKTMQEKLVNTTIQLEGCRVISNFFAAGASPASAVTRAVFSVVLSALKSHPDHPELQEQGRATLGVLFLSVDVGSSLTAIWDRLSDPTIQQQEGLDSIITGVEENVVATMQRYPNVANLQAQGCKALRTLLAFRASPKAFASSAIEAIVSAMNRHSTEMTVLLHGCAALAHLSFSAEKGAIIVNAGGVEALLLALRQNQLVPAIQTQGRTALANVFLFGSVPVILTTMRNHKKEQTVQKHGCRSLAKLSKDSENVSLILEHGGISLLVETLREFGQIPAVAEPGRAALLNLLHLAGVEALLQVMREHLEEPTVQQLGCRTLSKLCLVAEKGRLLVQNEGVGTILAALLTHPQLPALQAQGRAALFNLFQFSDIDTILDALRQNLQEPCLSLGFTSLYHLSNNEDNGGPLLEKGGFNLLIDIMQHHSFEASALREQARGILFNLCLALRNRLQSVETQRQGCLCLAAWSTKEGSGDSGVLKSVVDTVVGSLKSHMNDAELVQSGCACLANLSDPADNRVLILQSGAVQVLAKAMKHHLPAADIHEAGCRTLANLTTGNHEAVGQQTEQEVIDALVGALLAHGELPDLQEKAIHSIASLAINAENRTMFVNQGTEDTNGAIRGVLTAMRRHLPVTAVQQQGCYAIKNLTISHEYIRVLIAREGGIDDVLAALRAHPSDPDVQSLGCGALRNLARNRDNKVLIGQKGGIGSVLSGMRNNRDSPIVLTHCNRALVKLSSVKENRVLIAKDNGIHTILCGMREQKLDPQVQEYAFVVLRNLSCDADVGMVIVREGGVGTVIESMRNHIPVIEIQRTGFLILSNLATFAKRLLVQGGGVDAVKAAMAAHKEVPKLQSQGLASLNRIMHRCEGEDSCDTHAMGSSRRTFGRHGSSSIGVTYSGSSSGNEDLPYQPFRNVISLSMSF